MTHRICGAPPSLLPRPRQCHAPPAPSYYYRPPAPYYAPRPVVYGGYAGGYGGYRGYNGHGSNGGYYTPERRALRRRQLRAAPDTVRPPEWQLQPAPPAFQRLQHALGTAASWPNTACGQAQGVAPAESQETRRASSPPPRRASFARGSGGTRGAHPRRRDGALLRARIRRNSIEAVADRARVSKRTFYHRFDDKAALFSAVLHRIIAGLRPPAATPFVAGADLPHDPAAHQGLILSAALRPQALALHRLIVGESARFPKLAAAVTGEGATQEAIALIGGVLSREAEAERVTLSDPAFAAEQFMQMVLTIPQRRALGLGKPMTAAELEAWARAVVDLFLDGCMTRNAPRPGAPESPPKR